MKSIRLVLLISVITLYGLSNSVYADIDSAEVPRTVKEQFNQKYPNASKVEWERDKLNFEAEFELDGTEYEATFSEDGTWLETETEVTEKELPEKVAKAFKEKFPKAKIKEVEKVETPKSIFYEIEYKKGMRKKEAIFNTDGIQLQGNED